MSKVLDQTFWETVKHIHFIGIGGSGMFPIVQILKEKGYSIAGSDNNESDTVALERELGIAVTIGHSAKNVQGADMIVYTAAIMQDNPELIAARESGIPMFERAEVLGYLTRQYPDCICVSGTHGKTTTTAMLTQILLESGLDPTAIIGGKLPLIGGNGRAGRSDIMTCEACEFADHFLMLSSDISVILNIDADHLEYFGTLENIIRSFRQFAKSTRKCIIVNADDANSMKAVEGLDKPIITYGIHGDHTHTAANIQIGQGKSCFDWLKNGQKLATLCLSIPGMHNVYNALGAAAAALEVGATPEQVAASIVNFRGAGRRFEILGTVNGVTIADDYAHHPAELEVTLEAAHQMGFEKVWAVFQPFTYSRTAMLLDDFARVLSRADHVVLSEIMGSREKNTFGIHTRDLAEKIPGAKWFSTFEEIASHVIDHAKPGDLVITLGCGDVYKCAKMMLHR